MLRTRRSLAAAFACALLTSACAGSPSPLVADDGWSATAKAATSGLRPTAPEVPHVVERAKRQRWPFASEPAAWREVPGREVSEHGGGGFERTVLIDANAASYLTIEGVRTVPAGARVLERLHPAGREEVAAVYAMAKLPQGASPETGDWAFALLDPDLRVAVDGDLGACARCHAQSPHDGWFGPPAAPAAPTMK